MSTLTIRNLDDLLENRLRLRAAARNRSMEEEARQILRAALREPLPPAQDLGARIRARFAGLGDMTLQIEPREPARPLPAIDERAPAAHRPEARRGAGRPISQFDAQIAAIALQQGLVLATRNLADFEGCGLALINPWASRA